MFEVLACGAPPTGSCDTILFEGKLSNSGVETWVLIFLRGYLPCGEYQISDPTGVTKSLVLRVVKKL